MDLKKLRIFQMIQSALAVKGIFANVSANPAGFCCMIINEPFQHIDENDATEAELLEWHAEIERV